MGTGSERAGGGLGDVGGGGRVGGGLGDVGGE